jgi:hypothetical protein
MADQEPVDPTPAAGKPDPTRQDESADPATVDLPSRWSGAAPVPETGPRRSLWARLRDKVTGEPAADEDDWATMPAVDPWADQDTPLWPETYATDRPDGVPPTSLDAAPAPTRLDAAPAPTRLDAAAAYPGAASPAAAKAADAAEKAMADAIAAGAKVIEAAKAAAAVAAAKAAEQAAKAGQAAKAVKSGIADSARVATPTAPAAQPGATGRAGTPTSQPGTAGRPGAATAVPAPGTYPPPSAGTGLPPRRPSKLLPWRRAAASTVRQPASRIPVQPRPAPSSLAPGRTAPGRPTPPPWAAQPPRRRGRLRRWMRRMTLFTVLGLVLCCGGPLAYWQFPAARQYPVSAVLPGSFADLDLRDTAAGRRAAERLAEQLQEAGATGDAFAGIYTDKRGKRITLFGVTGWRLTPGSDVDAQLDHLTGELKLTDIQTFDTGEFGVHERCGTGRLDGTAVVACTWADHGSLATVLLTRRSLTESAELVAELRDTVLTPEIWG